MDKQKVKYVIDIVKDVDAGKILAVGGAALESIDLKKMKKKFQIVTEGPTFDKINGTVRLAKDIATWPVNYVEGLIGALKNK